MAAVDTNGDNKYWIDGIPFEGLRFEPSLVGTDRFWLNGIPETNMTPLQNFDTGKFFLVFE